jgi:hypothetical protein
MQAVTDYLLQMRRDCEYAPDPDEVDYPVNDSVDALIDYKDALEDAHGSLLDKLAALAGKGSAADQCQALYELLDGYGIKVGVLACGQRPETCKWGEACADCTV